MKKGNLTGLCLDAGRPLTGRRQLRKRDACEHAAREQADGIDQAEPAREPGDPAERKHKEDICPATAVHRGIIAASAVIPAALTGDAGVQKLPCSRVSVFDFLENPVGTVVASSEPIGDSTMVGSTERRRRILAEKFGDLANLAVAALVFGQAIGNDTFSWGVGLIGMAIWTVFMIATLLLLGEKR